MVWNLPYLQDLSDLQVMQNSALRYCYNVIDPCSEHEAGLHANANMQTVDIRRKIQKKLCLRRNIQNGHIERIIPTRLTRAGNGITIRLPIPRTELYKKSVYYTGSKLWNDLSEDTRSITELSEFKKNINALYTNCNIVETVSAIYYYIL